MPVEGTKRGRAPRDRGPAQAVGAELGEVALERLDVRGPRGDRPEPAREVSEVAPVRLDRPRREARRGEGEERVDGGIRSLPVHGSSLRDDAGDACREVTLSAG